MRPRLQTSSVLGSPVRNLVSVLIFMAVVVVGATLAYMAAGWSFTDASYMVALTVYTVGYGEVRPIDTAYLHAVTMGTMVLGCTGMILLTSSLVQFFTVMQLRQIMGEGRMQDRIDKLSDHIIICGYGRIGMMLARELAAAKMPLVVVERSSDKITEIQAAGHLCFSADATEESTLEQAGIGRARALATVLPDDAANVFITLSARKLAPEIEIIARGEVPSTESKLRHAGANEVVLPTHIGAERIARMLIYPESTRMPAGDALEGLARSLDMVGLELQQLAVAERSAMAGLKVAEAERRGAGAFFLVGLDRGERRAMVRPAPDETLKAGDHVLVLARPGAAAALSLFTTRETIRVGRNKF